MPSPPLPNPKFPDTSGKMLKNRNQSFPALPYLTPKPELVPYTSPMTGA